MLLGDAMSKTDTTEDRIFEKIKDICENYLSEFDPHEGWEDKLRAVIREALYD